VNTEKIAVVIPCYRVRNHILAVIAACGPEVWRIYVVDDCCPEKSGAFVRTDCTDSRVAVIENAQNLGVGGAVIVGYRAALAEGAEVVVKIDGDGQMNPRLIPVFVRPIMSGEADYTKGNRFYNIEDVRAMPAMRLLGNAALSFLTKLSSGYWNIFDPTNGYTAIHRSLIAVLPLDKISSRYFFESDMLFRLNTFRARVFDIPMRAVYGEEKSNLSVLSALPTFFLKNTKNFFKRILYNYYLRDFSVASLELLIGTVLMVFGLVFGVAEWIKGAQHNTLASTGTVMLAVLPIIVGLQLLISFINFDVMSVPDKAAHRFLSDNDSNA
jgi:glycosyltransferase involved in cell wall biosynthesis